MTTFTPQEYVKIDIANQYGKDKLSFAQRIAWVDSIKDLHKYVDKAEKPAQFLAAVYALEDSINKAPSGHLVGLDACASGITILGILAGCETTSKNTGVVGSKRMDMYGECTKAMIAEMQDTTSDIIAGTFRGDVKQAQMTHFYGSTAVPKRVFGEDTDELIAFYTAQELVAPGACIMMRELLDSWQPFELKHSHTLPDGFNAIVPVLQKCKTKVEIDELDHATLTYIYEDNVGSEKGLAVAANITHAVDGFIVRELVRRCSYDRDQLTDALDLLVSTRGNITVKRTGQHPMETIAHNHGFVSLRGVEFITDAAVLKFHTDYREELITLIKEILAKPSFDVLTIHKSSLWI